MRLSIVVLAILELTLASPSEYVDPNCPDYDLSLICTSICDDQYLECVTACSSPECLMDCNRASNTCIEACPCHTDCLEGCKDCENPICFCNDATNDDNLDACVTKNSKTLGQCILDCNDDSNCEMDCVVTFKTEHSECPCQDKCPLGCPCNNYDCDLPEKKAILALYSRSSKPSVLIQPNGGLTNGFEFQMDEDTEVHLSCSAKLNGELYIFGGTNGNNDKTKQISKIVGCRLKRIGDLNYDFLFGACGSFMFPQERILLCFSKSNLRKCESYDGVAFRNHANSKNDHQDTTLANHEGSPLIVGGISTNKVETYDFSKNTWTEVEDYPYHDNINGYATVTTSQGVLIIGGREGSSDKFALATTACYNKSGWSRLDDLQSTRNAHRAIINGDKVYVIGGSTQQYTEIWSDNEQSKTIQLAEPQLIDYWWYPELMIVDTTFCVKP